MTIYYIGSDGKEVSRTSFAMKMYKKCYEFRIEDLSDNDLGGAKENEFKEFLSSREFKKLEIINSSVTELLITPECKIEHLSIQGTRNKKGIISLLKMDQCNQVRHLYISNMKITENNFTDTEFDSLIVKNSEIITVKYLNVRIAHTFSFYYLNINSISLEGLSASKLTIFNIRNKEGKQLRKENFLDQETARIFKNYYEGKNNIVKANPYFVIEQDFYAESTEKWSRDRFTVRLSRWISHYGTDWFLVLLVMNMMMLLYTAIYAFLLEKTTVFTNTVCCKEKIDISWVEHINRNSFDSILSLDDISSYFPHLEMKIFFIILGLSIFSYGIYLKSYRSPRIRLTVVFTILMSFIIAIYSSEDVSNILNASATLINPFNIFKPQIQYFKNYVLFGMFIKFTFALLYYQFMISFAQNTRRH